MDKVDKLMKTAQVKLGRRLNSVRMAAGIFIIAATLILAVMHVLPYFTEEPQVISFTASGHNDLGFAVHYLDNPIFAENPVPSNLTFLMSFTDYIELTNRFNIGFDHATEVDYHFTATQYLRILLGGSANNTDVVYEDVTILAEASGSQTASSLNFSSENNSDPGGTFVIYPKDHIDFYLYFIEAQANMMTAENVTLRGGVSFSAELYIEFTYHVSLPQVGIADTSSRSVRIPLSNEAFTLHQNGQPTVHASQNGMMAKVRELNMIILVVLGAFFLVGVVAVLYSVRALESDHNPGKEDAMRFISKYNNEVVVSKAPIDLTSYPRINVDDFRELVKLSVNLNKHITAYYNGEWAEFHVIVDGRAFVYRMAYKYASHDKDHPRYRVEKNGIEGLKDVFEYDKHYGKPAAIAEDEISDEADKHDDVDESDVVIAFGEADAIDSKKE